MGNEAVATRTKLDEEKQNKTTAENLMSDDNELQVEKWILIVFLCIDACACAYKCIWLEWASLKR